MGSKLPSPAKFDLKPDIRDVIKGSTDPLVQRAEASLTEFGYYKVMGEQYVWKYLPDAAFRKYVPPIGTCEDANRALLSHLVRIIEAFEIVAAWRARDLVSGVVSALNDDRLISACVTSRSLIELAVTYLEAQNRSRKHLEEYPWEHFTNKVLQLYETQKDGKQITLESLIERFMAGTKLSAVTNATPELSQTNILTCIGHVDKALKRQRAGYSVMPMYEVLCEVAHPNALGFKRYLDRERRRSDGWLSRELSEHANGEAAQFLIECCLWALTFSTETIQASFGEFQKVFKLVGARLGRPLPYG